MKRSISIPSLSVGAIVVIFLVPILAGIACVVMPALGYLPALGCTQLTLTAWQTLLSTPALVEMLGLSVWVGIASTLFSLLLALSVVSAMWGNRSWQQLTRWLSPMMAAPHVALAFGLSFLIIPSGLLGRVLAPVADWQYPPGWQTTQDSFGISLIVLLLLKETPFLVFMLMAALERLPVRKTLYVGQILGYQPWASWLKLLWPQLYPMIRLPVFTVLAFSLSVVDIALILGPDSPPVFSVQVFQWLQDADLSMQLPAAAGSLMLAMLVLAAILFFLLLETFIAKYGRQWLSAGGRGEQTILCTILSRESWRLIWLVFTGSLLCLVLWSFVWRWRFPSLWPSDLSLRSWQTAAPYLFEPLYSSLLIGCASSVISTVFAIILLEGMDKSALRFDRLVGKIMYLPLLLPQISLLFGIQILALTFTLDGSCEAVIFTHILFVLPYCYLSLTGAWRSFDSRQMVQALLLSRSKWIAFWKVKVPMLWRPLVTSFALGFAVSMAQYLPTLFVGAGRIQTITTEAVSLSSGGNRRLIGVYALVQMCLPMVIYALAMLSARWSIVKGRWRLTE